MEERTCKFCGTELAFEEARNCYRCMKCNPDTELRTPVKKEDPKYVQEGLTDRQKSQVREICRDELENWHQITTVHKETGALKLTDVAIKNDMDNVVVKGGGDIPEGVEIPSEPPKWTDQAESLDIKWRGRKKDDVLQEIEDKLTAP